MIYVDPIIQEIIDKIKKSNETIKEYYHGDPLLIAKSNLPALAISKATTAITDENAGEDAHSLNMVITVVTDIRQDFNAGEGLVVGWGTLYDIMEGRNKYRTLKSSSIVDILKKNANLAYDAQIDVESPMRIDYGLTVGKRGERALATEANLFFTVFFDQLRN